MNAGVVLIDQRLKRIAAKRLTMGKHFKIVNASPVKFSR